MVEGGEGEEEGQDEGESGGMEEERMKGRGGGRKCAGGIRGRGGQGVGCWWREGDEIVQPTTLLSLTGRPSRM